MESRFNGEIFSSVITDYSGLTASKKFAKLVQVASKKISRGWIPKRGKPDSTQIGDNEISYTYYINWIDQDREKRNKEDIKKMKPRIMKPRSQSPIRQRTIGKKLNI